MTPSCRVFASNAITIAVNPRDPDHLVAGSNDHFQCYDGAMGAVRRLVPTGFFTSLDGGETWLDGQIPFSAGDGAGDPSVAFNVAEDVVLMAQIEILFGVSLPLDVDVSVSRSLLDGLHWEGKDATVFHGDDTGLAVDSRGRAHVVWTGMNRFVTSTQRDPYTGRFHDGYAQDAMYARR